MEKYSDEMVKRWNGEIDTLLVYVRVDADRRPSYTDRLRCCPGGFVLRSTSSSSRRPRLLPVKAWPYGRHIMIHDSFELLRERIASETIEGAPKSALQAGEVM